MSPASKIIRLKAKVAALFLICVFVSYFFLKPIFQRHEKFSSPSFSDSRCQKKYQELYNRDRIDIRIVFGYKDARPARFVGDRYERALWLRPLLADCISGEGACGFARSEGDDELFEKEIAGPDGRPRKVGLRVLQSSVGPDDEENRNDPFQKWNSERVRKSFLEGLATADVVFYNGHSRNGGGPDFQPPMIAGNGNVRYKRYQIEKPGIKELLSVLEANHQATIKLLGFFSCASTRWFEKPILDLKKGIGLITNTQLVYFSDALENMTAALSALLTMKCQPDFDRILKGGSKADPKSGSTQVGIKSVGLLN